MKRAIVVVLGSGALLGGVLAAPAVAGPSDQGACNGGRVSSVAREGGGVANAFRTFGLTPQDIGPAQQELHQDFCRAI